MLNKAVLLGRMVKDAELRSTASGTSVASFTVAVDSGWGDNKKTDFINCVAFGKTAEFVSSYFKKGELIALEGRISVRSYEGNDGKRNYVTEVVANEVTFCGGKKETESEAPALPSFDDVPDIDEDMPF